MIRFARLLPLAALLMAGAGLAQPPGGGGRMRGGPGGGGYADPSGVIAAEMAKGRLAGEKGEAAALAKMGAKDAILFMPQPVFAQRWIKGKSAQQPVRWRTQMVYMSCDGREAVTVGYSAQPDGKQGWYTTIWRRDPKAGFQWILNHGGPLTKVQEVSDEITARVAFCKRRERPQPGEAAKGDPNPAAALDSRQAAPMNWEDKSADGSLRWRWAVAPDRSRTLDVWMATEGGEVPIVTDRVPPPVS